MRKWRRRLLLGLASIFVLYVFVKLADFVWFRSQLPVTFANANWSGKWETQRYGGLSGNLVVRLPDPLPENQDFAAEALVYYPVYSAWKTGQFVKMDFQGHFSPDTPSSAGRSTNAIPSGGPGKLKFKGTVGNQVVEYVAIITESRTRIVGSYLSTAPYDYGYFNITNP
jgi:hypothetical protein